MCCFFLCNLSQQPPVCPLVVCFVWQKSAVVQAADRTPWKAVMSCVFWTIVTLLGNPSRVCDANWTDTHPFMVIHLMSQYPVFLRNTDFFFYVIGVLLLWKSYWYPPIWVSWQIVIFTATKSHKWTSGLLAHIFLGWKMSVFFFFLIRSIQYL